MEDLATVQGQVLPDPKQPLRSTPPAKPLSVLIVGVDSMRSDMAVPRVAPNMEAFASKAIQFTHHRSGGNGTRPGLFPLSCDIPSTYYQAFYAAQQAPVRIETFQCDGCDVGVFPRDRNEMVGYSDRSAFRSVPNLPGKQGDREATQGWLGFLDHRETAKPFFGFVFYESAPGGCRPGYPGPEGTDLSAPGEIGRRG